MCTTGINTADYKLALHQQEQLAEHLAKSLKQWSDLAGLLGQKGVCDKIAEAAARANEAAAAVREAAHEIEHVHGDHDHGVTITSA